MLPKVVLLCANKLWSVIIWKLSVSYDTVVDMLDGSDVDGEPVPLTGQLSSSLTAWQRVVGQLQRNFHTFSNLLPPSFKGEINFAIEAGFYFEPKPIC